MSDPLVSAVVTTYGRPGMARRAIKSAVNQTHEPLEVIVVEDGSDSGVREWLMGEYDEGVTYIAHERNRGTAAARNTGIEAAGGDYIAFLDDDDLWKPLFLERATALAEGLPADEFDRLGVVYAALEIRSAGGEPISVVEPKNEGNLRESIMEAGANTLDSSLFFPRHALEDVGGWDEDILSGEVHDMWMQLACAGYHAKTINEALVVMFQDSHGRKTTDLSVRLDGVRDYLDKWEPTYREWFGPEAGRRYADRYFARVISRLAAFNLVAGDFSGSVQALRAVFTESDDAIYNVRTFLYFLGEASTKQFLPPRLTRVITEFR